MTTAKEKLVKAMVTVQQSWVSQTGAEEIFRSANVNPHSEVLLIPVTQLDISDSSFVEIVFWPTALAKQTVKSVKAYIPKHAVTLIVELKSPDMISALGYKTSA
jgi:hypothetical protein